MKLFFIAKFFLPLAFITSLLCGLIYISGQQILRQGANNPQIQMSEDSATRLEAGSKPADVVGVEIINIEQSIAPFLIVYDKKGNVIASSARLQNNVPSLPKGVLQTSELAENRLTWQPAEGVRVAAVVVSYKNGYVLAGRSLREVEKRENTLFMQVAVAWIVTIVGTLVVVGLFSLVYPNKKR